MTRTAFPSLPPQPGPEPLARRIERAARAGTGGYPPFDIVELAPDRYAIALAVAGFREADLAVTLEHRQLVIRGHHPEPEGRVFLHRGIGMRRFRRIFALADGVEVAGAHLENGLLVVTLERAASRPEARSIPIARPTAQTTAQTTART
jgi:HSP20 family molecular chaperone IbpA